MTMMETVFQLDPATTTFTVLHIFNAGNGGAYPYTPLILDSGWQPVRCH